MTPSNWRINILLAVGVVFTLIVALLMAQLDGLQIQLRLTAVPVANVPFGLVTNTPLPAIPLQSATPNPIKTTLPSNETVAETAVSLLPSCNQTPSDWVTYQVGSSDTLSSLAIVYNVSESTILQANCLQMATLLSGMAIYLPARPLPQQPSVNCGPPAYWVLYQVRPGDTIYALASSRGVRVYDVLYANCSFESSYLQAGMLIYLPPTVIFPTAVPTMFMTPISTETAVATETTVVTETATPLVTGTAVPTIIATLPITQTPTGTITPALTATPGGTVTPTIFATGTTTPIATATPLSTPVTTLTATPIPIETAVSTATPLVTPLPSMTPNPTGTAVSPTATPILPTSPPVSPTP